MPIADYLERYLLGLINEERALAGLSALTIEQNLTAAADAHSQWMSDTRNFGHTGVDGTSPTDRIIFWGFDVSGSWGTGENVGAQQVVTPDSYLDEIDFVHEQLMNSPGHRANILDEDFTYAGISIFIGPGPFGPGSNVSAITVTQTFGYTTGPADLDLLGTAEADTMSGQRGDDFLNAGAGADVMLGNAGNDTLQGGAGDDAQNGGSGDDLVNGDDGDDFVRGETGNDTLNGGAGNDFALGDAGDDVLAGGAGQDSLSGGDGNDLLQGGTGFDEIQGGAGNDTLSGGAQADNLFASGGDDLLQGDAGFDRLFGGFGDDTLEGGDGPDALFGNGGADVLNGGTGDDRNIGGGGNDLIEDGLGNDLLEAGAGFDTLNGGAGDDLLFGRFNADTFVFTDTAGGFGNDTIGDFAATNDFERIDLSGVAEIINFADLIRNHMTQDGRDVLIDAGEGSSIRLTNVNLAQLDVNDFTF